MNCDMTLLMFKIYRRACEGVYKIIHTREHVIQDPEWSIKLPLATLRSNLLILKS